MKIAVIGAGITGLYSALKLAEKGCEVSVFEKRNKIGKEACSGLFSQIVLDFIPQSKELTENEIKGVLIHFPKKTLKIEFQKKFFVMSHFKLDNLVADSARKRGVKIFLNREIKEKDIAEFKKEFDRIIISDGALSQTRKVFKLKEPKFYLGIQTFLLEDFYGNEEFVETWPTKNGFLWKIPRLKINNKREIEYGIFEEPKEARKIFEDFLNKNKIKTKEIKSAVIPQGMPLFLSEKIAFLGDAAGLTKPWSGGGVSWSLFNVNILLKNFPDFLKYQKETRKFFLPRIIFGKFIKKIVYFLGFNFPWILPKKLKIEGDFLWIAKQKKYRTT